MLHWGTWGIARHCGTTFCAIILIRIMKIVVSDFLAPAKGQEFFFFRKCCFFPSDPIRPRKLSPATVHVYVSVLFYAICVLCSEV